MDAYNILPWYVLDHLLRGYNIIEYLTIQKLSKHYSRSSEAIEQRERQDRRFQQWWGLLLGH